jgi:two-component system, sensor histidine kinase PdtaS
MRNTFHLFCCLLFLGFHATAQVTPSESIKSIIKKARAQSTQNIDSALYFAHQAVQLAENADSVSLVFQAYRAIGMINEDNSRLAEAQKAYAAALALADTKLTIDDQLLIYTDWAIIHKKMGQYKTALDYHWLTIKRAEKVQNWEVAEEGYHGLGTLYSMLSDFNQSIHYYLLSIQAAEKWGNTEGVILTQQNISNIYMKAKNNDMALQNIEKTYQMALKKGDSSRIAAVLGVYGNIETAVGNYQNALAKHLEANTILEKRGDKKRLVGNYMSIGYIYFQQKNYAQAEAYYAKCRLLKDFFTNYIDAEFHNKLGQLSEAKGQINNAITAFETSLSLTNAFGFKEIAKENHEALAKIYNQNKQFDKAYRESGAVNELNEVLFKESTQKSMTEAQFKFDVEKRDLQIEGQNKELRHSAIIRWLLIGGLMLTLVLLYITWLQMRKKQEAKKRIELVIKELHHRVKNNIQTIASMMRLQARQVKDPSVSAVLLENKLRLETFSMLHQQLYQTDDLQKVDLQPFIRGIIEKLLFSYSIPYDKINTHITVENKLIDVETAIPLGLMLNELLTNSFKYAYPSVETLDITIDIKSKSLHYADNGTSLPDDFDFNKKAGFGMNLIQSFAQQLKGKYQFSKQKGIDFQLKFN